MMNQLILAALLLPAAAQANQIWQVVFDYPDRVQFLTPTPDETYYFSLGPLIAEWESLGYLLGANERICPSNCVAAIVYKSAGFGSLGGDRDPVTSPEPGTLSLFVIGLIAGIGSLWNSRRIA